MSILNKYKSLVIITSVLTLPACSWFSANDGSEDIDDRYMRSQLGPELQVPPTVKQLSVDDRYRVPEGVVITRREAKGKQLSLNPPQLLLIGGDGVREDSEQAHPTVWVRHQGTPIMDYVNRFVQKMAVPVKEVSAERLTTEWISDEDDTQLAEQIGAYNLDGQRHRFSLEVIGQNNNEVALQVRNTASQRYDDGKWLAMEPSNTVASQFLNAFLGYYDSERTKEARQRILEEGSIDISLGVNQQGQVALVTERDFIVVWEQLPRVLKELNLAITDRDQSSGIYYIEVKEPETGFWAALTGDDDDNPKVDMEPGNYQILVQTLAGGGVSLTFKDDEGQTLDSNITTKIYPEFAASFKRRGK